MLKVVIFVIALPLLINIFPFNKDQLSQTKQDFAATPTPTALPDNSAKVESLDLNKTQVIIPCPPGINTPEYCSDDMSVDVFTKAIGKNHNALIYKYTISGGKIIGQGAKVKWDLSGVRPGIYEIKAEVDEGCNFCGESVSKIVEVKQCDSCLCELCTCPLILIASPRDNVKSGEIIAFTVNINGGSQVEVNYKWTVKNGYIVEGQATPSIKVNNLPDSEIVTATVEIDGLCGDCQNKESYTVKIFK